MGMEKFIVSLTLEERQQLDEVVGKGRHAAGKVINALILLNCDRSQKQERRTSEEIATVLQISARTIDRIKRRFVEEGFEAVLDRKPSTREFQHKIDGEIEAHLVALCCSEPPAGRGHWSLRLLAEKMVELEYVDMVSHETVRRTLKK
jgi:transposase